MYATESFLNFENKLGIYFFSDDDNQIFDKIKRIIDYLTNKVDYYLII